jgi:hypothetical protein
VLWQGTEYRSAGYTGRTDDRGHGLAALYGLAGPERLPAVRKVLSTSFEASPYMEKYILEALFRMGDTEAALARMKSRYRKMVESELSTLWEGWGIGPEGYGGGSYNHGWSGGPLTLLGEYVSGLAPATPGFETFDVRPRLGPLRRVRSGMESVRGRIEIEAERGEKHFRLRVVAPAGTTARVGVPLALHGLSRVECAGRDIWPLSLDATPPAGLRVLGADDTHVTFSVPPGDWEFIAR